MDNKGRKRGRDKVDEEDDVDDEEVVPVVEEEELEIGYKDDNESGDDDDDDDDDDEEDEVVGDSDYECEIKNCSCCSDSEYSSSFESSVDDMESVSVSEDYESIVDPNSFPDSVFIERLEEYIDDPFGTEVEEPYDDPFARAELYQNLTIQGT